MNRLILVGNGFDLAHGLKTAYNDLIVWYLKNSFSQAFENQLYEDDIISIKRNYNEPFKLGKIDSISSYIDYYYSIGFDDLLNNRSLQFPNNTGTTYRNYFTINIKSILFKELTLKCSTVNWVDIENEFYRHLKQILNIPTDSATKESRLLTLNESLKSIIKLLESYLKTIDIQHYHAAYYDIFNSKVIKDDVVTSYLIGDEMPKDSLILNFNYTQTVERYFNSNYLQEQPKSIAVNYIHGKVNDLKKPLIFGFGDELDDDYLRMEHERARGFFQYIKSFWYFKTSNYHNLIRFIQADEYQVFILGHSCGLSDRTMLNMIFEHSNCKSIKIFYYQDGEGNNNFRSLTQEISKHFKNKVDMRMKIVPFDKSFPMPQVTNSN